MCPAKKSVAKQSAANKSTAKKPRAKEPAANKLPQKKAGANAPTVVEFLQALKHPEKETIVRLREILLAADSSIVDEVKWNAPSYRTSEFFATTHLRAKTGTAVILHFGAKKRAINPRSEIADPGALLQWLADDRAMVSFANLADLNAKRIAFLSLIRAWIEHV